MNQQIPNRLEITEKTYPVGAILVRPAKSARVLSIARDHKTGKVFKGFTCLITTTGVDGVVREQRGLLRIPDLEVPPERGGWKLRKVEPADVHKEATTEITAPAPGDTLTRANGDQAKVIAVEPPFVQAAVTQNDERHEEIMTADEANRWPLMPPSPTDSDLTATAARIQQLQHDLDDANNLIASLRQNIEIAATYHRAEITRITAEHQTYSEKVDAAWQLQIATLTEKLDEAHADWATDSATSERLIKSLTEQLAESKAAAVAHSSPSLLAERGAGGEVLSAPIREFKILRYVSEADLCRMEKENWQIQHMQFAVNTDLNVVYYRIVAAPPEPAHQTVTAVGPQVVIQPVESLAHLNATSPQVIIQPVESLAHLNATSPQVIIQPVEHITASQRASQDWQEALAEGQRVYNQVMAQSPVRPFMPFGFIPAQVQS